MPPIPTWFTGRDAVREFLARVVLRTPDQWRLAYTRANGAPAFALYQRAPDSSFRASGLDVLSLVGGRIARIVAFNDPTLVAKFGLPETITESPARPNAPRT
jgi:RNA polymerase sigma-70 factor (ECF subfamily)